jgi:hypothetical protein
MEDHPLSEVSDYSKLTGGHICHKGEMKITNKILTGNMKVIDHSEDLGVDGRINGF